MRHGPDATIIATVYLTTTEIGKAFANRGDDEQVEILKAIIAGFDDPTQAIMQANHIGARLLNTASEIDTERVIDFLRTILDSLATKAADISRAATPRS